MIIGSVLLILVATALFAAGLFRESGSYYYSSIVISVLAGFSLVVSLRQARGRLALADDFDLGQDASRTVRVGGPVLPAPPRSPLLYLVLLSVTLLFLRCGRRTFPGGVCGRNW